MLRFEKVGYCTFQESIRNIFGYVIPDEEIERLYNNIKLPSRGTKASAGYDFFCPLDITLVPGSYQLIPTGIRFVTDLSDVALILYPRSGLGFKSGMKLRNTCGIIDSDFFLSSTGGHIMVKVTAEEPLEISAGKAFCQGIITPFLKVDEDDASETRTGGFGSTGR